MNFSISSNWVILVIAGINASLGNVFLKKSQMNSMSSDLISNVMSLWFLGGLMFYGVNVILFAKALKVIPVSVAYPVLAGVGFFSTSILAIFYFDESMSLHKITGIILILIGMMIVGK